MKIAISIEILRHIRTGLAQYTYRLVQAMDRAAGDNSILLFNNSFRRGKETLPVIPEMSNPLVSYRNLIISRKLLRPLQKATGLPRLEHLIGRIDVFHAPAHDELPFTHAGKVATIHDLSALHGNFYVKKRREQLAGYFKSAVSWADAVIADSESTRNDIIEILGADPAKVVRVYLAASDAMRPITDADAVRISCNEITGGRDFILYVGTLEPRKNVANLIRAYNIFRAGIKDAPLLLLCGRKGWMYDEILAEHAASPFRDDILMPGFIPDDRLPFLLNGAMFFIYPSFFEGFGLPVLEAMACGTPVITSNVSSLPEVGGDAALLVSPGSPEEMAHAMGTLAENPELRLEMARKGLAHSATFSWSRCAEETMEVYRRVCK